MMEIMVFDLVWKMIDELVEIGGVWIVLLLVVRWVMKVLFFCDRK